MGGREHDGAPTGRLTRRQLLAAAGGLALAGRFGLAGCQPAPPLRVGMQSWCGYQFMRLADKLGWLHDQPVEFVQRDFAEDVSAGLFSGELDCAGVTLEEALTLRDRGVPLQVCLVFDVSAGADLLLARPGIETLADLRGRRIGVEDTTLGTLMLSEVLRAAKLRRAEVKVVRIDEDHAAAWQRGGLDAIVTYGVAGVVLQQQGLNPLIDSRELRRVIVDVLAVRKDAEARQPRALRALVAGHFRALNLWHHNPIDTAYQLAPLVGVRPAEVRDVFEGLELPDAAYNRHYLSGSAEEMHQIARNIREALAAPHVDRVADDADLFVAKYLPEASV